MTTHRQLTRSALATASLVAVAVLTAACDSNNDSTTTTSPASGTSDTVSVADVGGRSVLVTSDGLPIYTSDEEQANGGALCVSDGCVSFWEPVTADTDTPTGDVDGTLGTLTRPDETEQVTLDGTPLYTFSHDSSSEINGDGLSDTFDGQTLTWHVVTTDGSTGTTDNQGGGYNY